MTQSPAALCDPAQSQALHQRLRDAAAQLPAGPVSLAQLAHLIRLAEWPGGTEGAVAQGSWLLLLAMPCLLPVPGVGNVLGLALVLLAWTLWRGVPATAQPNGWRLSPRVAAFPLPRRAARRVLCLLAACYGGAGRWSRQRLTGWAAAAQPRVAGGPWPAWLCAQVALMGGIIFLPLPLGNVLPAAALVLLGLGLAFRDGLAVLLAGAVALAALAYTVAFGVVAWAWGLAPLLGWLPTLGGGLGPGAAG